MDFEFSYDENIHIIKLESETPNSFKALLKDKQFNFDISPTSENSFSFINGNKSFIGYVAESDNAVFVHIGGHIIKLNKVLDDQNSFKGAGVEYGAKDQITAPMPGKVVKILVSEGDEVKAKQPLVILESMKMENEILSPVDGSVKSIHFKAGDLVEPDKPIIKLTPKEE